MMGLCPGIWGVVATSEVLLMNGMLRCVSREKSSNSEMDLKTNSYRTLRHVINESGVEDLWARTTTDEVLDFTGTDYLSFAYLLHVAWFPCPEAREVLKPNYQPDIFNYWSTSPELSELFPTRPNTFPNSTDYFTDRDFCIFPIGHF